MNSTARQSNGSTMSTLESIAAELPNGFHDSSLRRVVVDYVDRRATLALNVWVGDLKAATDAEREAYRSIDVTISGLLAGWVSRPSGPVSRTQGLAIQARPSGKTILHQRPAYPRPNMLVVSRLATPRRQQSEGRRFAAFENWLRWRGGTHGPHHKGRDGAFQSNCRIQSWV